MTLEIDPTARISKLADIEDSVRGTLIRIGAGSIVDSFVKFKPAGGSGNVEIGDNVTLNSGCVIYTGNGLRIGNNVAIAANCTFAPVNHAFEDRNRLIVEQGFQPSRGGITIGDDVWIGANCVFLDGAVVNTGCVIGAGSVVKGTIPAYTIVAGNPLRRIGIRK
ncbi:acyltransferase [Labrenzia sp. 011]|uniref:acyltransferase n=1 Tax=Labrenzia sp. 011 TaxID=2171494 RepID=UPI000D521CBA|nr:acyltransferase [Labrenzia sp. 011]PVB62262.1 acetyltransferase [Labrenzia sp. 011]